MRLGNLVSENYSFPGHPLPVQCILGNVDCCVAEAPCGRTVPLPRNYRPERKGPLRVVTRGPGLGSPDGVLWRDSCYQAAFPGGFPVRPLLGSPSWFHDR